MSEAGQWILIALLAVSFILLLYPLQTHMNPKDALALLMQALEPQMYPRLGIGDFVKIAQAGSAVSEALAELETLKAQKPEAEAEKPA